MGIKLVIDDVVPDKMVKFSVYDGEFSGSYLQLGRNVTIDSIYYPRSFIQVPTCISQMFIKPLRDELRKIKT